MILRWRTTSAGFYVARDPRRAIPSLSLSRLSFRSSLIRATPDGGGSDRATLSTLRCLVYRASGLCTEFSALQSPFDPARLPGRSVGLCRTGIPAAFDLAFLYRYYNASAHAHDRFPLRIVVQNMTVRMRGRSYFITRFGIRKYEMQFFFYKL